MGTTACGIDTDGNGACEIAEATEGGCDAISTTAGCIGNGDSAGIVLLSGAAGTTPAGSVADPTAVIAIEWATAIDAYDSAGADPDGMYASGEISGVAIGCVRPVCCAASFARWSWIARSTSGDGAKPTSVDAFDRPGGSTVAAAASAAGDVAAGAAGPVIDASAGMSGTFQPSETGPG